MLCVIRIIHAYDLLEGATLTLYHLIYYYKYLLPIINYIGFAINTFGMKFTLLLADNHLIELHTNFIERFN